MTHRRPFVRTPNPADAADAPDQPPRFRHRFAPGDVIDHVPAQPRQPVPVLDRAGRRAAKCALRGYGLCLAALSASGAPTWSRAA